MCTSPPPSTRYLPLSFRGKFSTPASCSTPHLGTVVVIYLYCPSAQQGSVCPCPSWVTCKRASRAQRGVKNKICLWVFPVPQHRRLLVFIIVIISISANLIIVVSSVLKPTPVGFTSHPPCTCQSETAPFLNSSLLCSFHCF